MKHRNQLVRVLLLVLSVAMVISLAACASNSDLDAAKAELEKQIEELKNNSATKNEVQSNAAADAEVKAALEEAKALLDTVKGTADAAATKAALEKVSSDLASVTTVANAAATKVALDAAVEDLEELAAAVASGDTALSTALAGAVAALEAADAANKAELETKINNALTQLQAAKTELDGKITAAKTELQGNIDALAARVSAIENASTASDIAALQTAVSALQAAVKALEDENFPEKYALATKMLAGDEVTVGDVTYPAGKYSYKAFETQMNLDETKFADDTYAEYLENANYWFFMLGRATTIEEVISYFKALETEQKNLETLEQSLRKQLDAYYGVNSAADGLLTLASADSVAVIKSTYQKMVDNGTDFAATANLVDLKGDYDALVAAYDNLLAAKAAADSVLDLVAGTPNGLVALIEAESAKMVVYGQFAEIVAIRDNFDNAFVPAFFADAAKTVFYAKDAEGVVAAAAAVVSNYAKLTTMEARKAVLEAAYAVIPSVDTTNDSVDNIDATYLFATVTPLYSQANALANKQAEIEAWMADSETGFALEIENVKAMYAAKYADENVYEYVKDAAAYADGMNDIYVAHNVNNKVEDVPVADSITTLVAELVNQHNTTYGTLYNEYAKAEGVLARMSALQAAVVTYADTFGAIDGNYAAMAAEFNATGFAEVWARMGDLKTAEDAVDAIVVKMNEMLGNVTFGSYERHTPNIKDTFDGGLKAIYTTYSIVDDETIENNNWDLIAAEADALLAALKAEYMEATAKVAVIYAKATWLMEEMTANGLLLKKGNDIAAISAELSKLVLEVGVDNANLGMTVYVVEEIKNLGTEAEEIVYKKNGDEYVMIGGVVLSQLNTSFNTLVANYNTFAGAAQDEAAVVNAQIAALASATRNLKNRDAINAAYDALLAWIDAYLPDGTTVDTAKAELAEITAIKVFASADLYTFVTIANFDKAVAAKADSDDANVDAKAIAEDLIARMTVLLPDNGTRTWTIHSDDMTAIVNEFVAYLAEYYGQTVTVDEATATDYIFTVLATETYDFFTEIALLTGDFRTEYDAYVAACTQARVDAANIVAQIKALMLANPGNIAMDASAANVVAQAAAIQAEIDTFYATYCTDDCLFIEGDVNYAIELERIAGRAVVSAKFYEKQLTLTDAEVLKQLDVAYKQANLDFDLATTYIQVENARNYALSLLDTFVNP